MFVGWGGRGKRESQSCLQNEAKDTIIIKQMRPGSCRMTHLFTLNRKTPDREQTCNVMGDGGGGGRGATAG